MLFNQTQSGQKSEKKDDLMKKTAEFFNPYPRSNSEGYFNKVVSKETKQSHKPLVSMKFLKMISPDLVLGDKLRTIGQSKNAKEESVSGNKSFKRDYSLRLNRPSNELKVNKSTFEDHEHLSINMKSLQQIEKDKKLKLNTNMSSKRYEYEDMTPKNYSGSRSVKKYSPLLPSLNFINRKKIQTAEAQMQHTSNTSKTKLVSNPFFATGGAGVRSMSIDKKLFTEKLTVNLKREKLEEKQRSEKAFILESYKQLVLKKRMMSKNKKKKNFNKRTKSIDGKFQQKFESSRKKYRAEREKRQFQLRIKKSQKKIQPSQNSDRNTRAADSDLEAKLNEPKSKSEFEEPSFYPKFDEEEIEEKIPPMVKANSGHLFQDIDFQVNRDINEKKRMLHDKKRLMKISMNNIKHMIRDRRILEKNLGVSSGKKRLRKFKLQKGIKYKKNEPLPLLGRQIKN